MTHREESKLIKEVIQVLSEEGFEGMREVLQKLLNEVMKLERSGFLHAESYQRTPERRGHANGFKGKTVQTRLGELPLRIPQVRGLEPGENGFYPSSLEKGLRSERALKLAIAEMYVKGVSTRKVESITRSLCGLEISSTQVSRAAAALDQELESWRNRPLGEVPYLILDARFEKVRHGGSIVDAAVLVAIGVMSNGRRTVLGVSVSLSEAEVHWRNFLTSLVKRGLCGVRFITSDDHVGLQAARQAVFSGILWQRCQTHLQRNAVKYVPKVAMRAEVAHQLRVIFRADTRADADRQLKIFTERYCKTAPALASWAEENIPEGLTVLQLPPHHRTRMRTTNGLERLNREIKRRTRVATLFPNEESCLRLVTAVLMEISDEWETDKIYLNTECD
jgi:transposase-like protein